MPIVQQEVQDVYDMLTKFQANSSVFELPNLCLKAAILDSNFLDRFDNS
jgi:hypothetical protein